ncbi:MAG: hypothetical protein JOZ47_08840 [Kutzneria sp.]|nr:hypothetical protein [Kutzneria sp.]
MAVNAGLVWAVLHQPGVLSEAAHVAVEIRKRLDDAGAVLVKARSDLAELAPEVAGQMTTTLAASAEVAVRVSAIGDRARRLAG